MTRQVATLVLLMLAAGCGGGDGGGAAITGPSAPSAAVTFSAAPMDPAAIQFIVPLGNLNPPGHTLPTDHIYFYHHLNTGPFTPVPVIAPASGTIAALINRGGDAKIYVRTDSTHQYYFDHVTLAAGLGVGSRVDAGSRIGDSASIGFDFSVLNTARSQSFANPGRYSSDTLTADAPLTYFDEPVRSALYARVQRIGGELDGRISYDVAGTLAGNWFADDLAVSESARGDDPTVGMRQLAFVKDTRIADRLRISIGGFGMLGVYGVPAETADFSTVTPASGVVTYRLLSPEGTDQQGLLIVQMVDTTHIRVEAFRGGGTSASFSAAARIYLR